MKWKSGKKKTNFIPTDVKHVEELLRDMTMMNWYFIQTHRVRANFKEHKDEEYQNVHQTSCMTYYDKDFFRVAYHNEIRSVSYSKSFVDE